MMKVSELMAKLAEVLDKKGDLPVVLGSRVTRDAAGAIVLTQEGQVSFWIWTEPAKWEEEEDTNIWKFIKRHAQTISTDGTHILRFECGHELADDMDADEGSEGAEECGFVTASTPENLGWVRTYLSNPFSSVGSNGSVVPVRYNGDLEPREYVAVYHVPGKK